MEHRDSDWIKYKDENRAILAFMEFRLISGITCKKCMCKEHYWLPSKQQFQCKNCKFRTTLRSGSAVEGSKLPFHYFFIVTALLLQSGEDVNMIRLQQITGHKYLDPLWFFVRKIKKAYEEDSDLQKNVHSILLKYFNN